MWFAFETRVYSTCIFFKGKLLVVDEGQCCDINEMSICGPKLGLPSKVSVKVWPHCCSMHVFADVFVENKLEIVVADRPTTSF